MKLKEPIWETMARIKWHGLTIRLWLKMTDEFGPEGWCAEEKILEFLANYKPGQNLSIHAPFKLLIQRFGDHISAMEVVDGDGNGLVCYLEWP